MQDVRLFLESSLRALGENKLAAGFAYFQAGDKLDTLQVRLPDINGSVCVVTDSLLQHTRDCQQSQHLVSCFA